MPTDYRHADKPLRLVMLFVALGKVKPLILTARNLILTLSLDLDLDHELESR